MTCECDCGCVSPAEVCSFCGEMHKELEISKKARAFVRRVAALTQDQEELNGVPFDTASDDAVETLNRLLRISREIEQELREMDEEAKS